MKLLLCLSCIDVRKLHYEKVTCKCESSWGWYHEDGWNTSYGGNSIILGLDNNILLSSLQKHLDNPNTNEARLDAWIMADNTKTINKND